MLSLVLYFLLKILHLALQFASLALTYSSCDLSFPLSHVQSVIQGVNLRFQVAHFDLVHFSLLDKHFHTIMHVSAT